MLLTEQNHHSNKITSLAGCYDTNRLFGLVEMK